MIKPNRRIDWIRFSRQRFESHGVVVLLEPYAGTSPEALRTEKRLLKIIRGSSRGGPFALRRIFSNRPGRIECVFASSVDADELALVVGASASRRGSGDFATERFMLARASDCLRIWRLGSDT